MAGAPGTGGTDDAPALDPLIRLAMDHLADVVVVTDCQLDPPGPRIVYVNAAITRLCGYQPHELLGRSPRLLQGPDTDPGTLRRIHDALHRREAVEAELLNYTREGRPYWVAMHITPVLDKHGVCTHFVGIERDITARRQAQQRQAELEAQLRQAQKMESLGTLAGGIAHDFNNILAAILGQLDLVQQDLPPDAPVHAGLAQVRHSALRARALVEQILAFCRQGVPHFETVALDPLLTDIASLLRATLPAAVTLELERRSPGLRVEGNRSQLEQVLLNLVTNAWHALQGRPGRVVLGVEEAAADEGQDGGRAGAHLWVQDDGCGMDAATRDRIFDPFFTTKPAGQGTGLGLSVVHGIVTAHGGRIEVDSQPGHGTTFHVRLPASQARAAAPDEAPPQAPAHGQGECVLYVDDDPVVLMVAEQLLRRRGFRPVCTADPAEALAWVRAEPAQFEVLVTDYNMPTMNGADLARAVMRVRADLPVLMVSGFVTEEQHRQARAVRAWGPIDKQHCIDELAGWIARALQDRSGPSA